MFYSNAIITGFCSTASKTCLSAGRFVGSLRLFLGQADFNAFLAAVICVVDAEGQAHRPSVAAHISQTGSFIS